MSFLFLGVAASGFIAGSLVVLPYHCLRMARLRRENASRVRRINRIWQMRVAYWLEKRAICESEFENATRALQSMTGANKKEEHRG